MKRRKYNTKLEERLKHNRRSHQQVNEGQPFFSEMARQWQKKALTRESISWG